MAKICVKCGLDVANLPRTKDSQGNYYCKPCAEAATKRQAARQAPPQEPQEPVSNEPPSALDALAALAGGGSQSQGLVDAGDDPRDLELIVRHVQQDAGPYETLASSFTMPPRLNYKGTVLFSPKVIYLLKRDLQMDSADATDHLVWSTARGGGGLVGGLLDGTGGASQNRPGSHVETCKVKQLSAATRSAIDPKSKFGEVSVIAVAKETVSNIEDRRDGVAIKAGHNTFVIHCGFSMQGALNLLMQYGWPVKKQVTPAARPVFKIFDRRG